MRWCAHLYAGQASGHNNGNGGHVAMEALSPVVSCVYCGNMDTGHASQSQYKYNTVHGKSDPCYFQTK